MGTDDTKVPRPAVEAIDDILGVRIPLLDDGFIRVVDYMGNDASVVQAARVSYGAGTKKVHEDRGLIRYLMRHGHTTPFEMCEIKLHVRVPMDCWRQWIRHRTASVNEYSTRYSVAIDAAQRTERSAWRAQSVANRQGSGEYLPPEQGDELSKGEAHIQAAARQTYKERINAGVAREQARKDLPLSTYTEAYWKIDLHNLLHFLKLRMDTHAQLEIREYANAIGYKIVSQWCPIVWEAFVDYCLSGIEFTSIEFRVAELLINGKPDSAINYLTERGLLSPNGAVTQNRERTELEAKLHAIGLACPWLDQLNG